MVRMKKHFVSTLILSMLLIGAAIAGASTALHAQTSTATISGVISDSQGARVAGAKIVATNIDTGVSTTAQSDKDGVYSVSSLPIGNYRVEVQREGFRSTARGPLVLTVGKDDVEDFVLTVGDVSQTVEVSAVETTVDTASSSFGWLVGQQQIRELPLNGRNYVQLTLLAPGVQPVPQENSEGASTLVPFGFGSPQRFSVAGGRPQGELFLIDGTDTAGVWGNGTGANLVGTTLGVDGIAEFQVLTNTYTADYGGNGAALNAAIRSGTNAIHGSVYEFARNSALDARNYFDPTPGPLPFSRNQFGGTLGGPIIKNKTFYFVNYEGLRQDLTLPITTVVPDQDFRNGFLPCSQTILVPCDPTTNLANVGINPSIQTYLNTFPAPNGTVLGNGSALNTSSVNSPVAENYGVVRVDHTFSNSDSLFASYVIDNATLIAHPQPVLTDADKQRNQYLSVEEKKLISPTVLNVFHFAYVRSNISVFTLFNPDLLIVPGSGINGEIGVTGLNPIGGNDDSQELVNRFTFRDQLSYTRGRHSVDIGLEVVRHYVDATIPIINGGVAAYAPVPGLAPFPFQNFLMNIPLLFEGVPLNANNSSRFMRHTNLSPYIQDKFQITRRVTLNLGLRYDFETNPTEANGNLYNLIDPFTDTSFTKVPNAFSHNITKWNFQPRIGFAWDVFGNQKTALRGGFGAFADLPLEMQTIISYLFNPPIYDITEIIFPTIPNPFGGGGINTGLPSGPQLTAYHSKMNDYIMEYNLNVQQQLFKSTVLTVGYVGSRANHLFIGQETNPCLPTSTLADGTIVRDYASAATCPTVNPALSSVVDRFPVGTSNYNSFQIALDKGIGKYVQFRTAYTYSKCLDYGSYYTGNDSIGPNGQTAGLQAGNLANAHRNVDYGPCDFDLTHNWTSNLVFQLPFTGNRFKEGWQVTAISSVHSGTPYSVVDGIDQANVGQGGAAENAERPDVIGTDANPTGVRKTPGAVYGFDPSPFVLQPAGIFGDLGRNTLRASGVRDVDLGISKSTRITERTNLQLRLDIFNLANHTNFGFPSSALFTGVDTSGNGVPNPAAGLITSTSTTSRQLQLSAKFTF
jgi:hypothetical protein